MSLNIFQPKEILSSQTAGGKAYGLAMLQHKGVKVPPWVALSPELWKQAKEHNLLDPKNPSSGQKSFPFFQTSELKNTWKKLSANGRYALAARSSAIGEDSEGQSFAGQYESKLYLWSFEDLVQGILDVWKSADSDHIKVYKQDNGVSAVGVVIQRMVASDKSGVIFTADPLDGNRDILIESVWGLGEALVSGEVSSQGIKVDWDGKILSRTDTHPNKRLDYHFIPSNRYNRNGELKYTEVKTNGEILNSREIFQLVKEIKKLPMGIPWDIEFAIEKGEVFLLQVRPITTLGNESLVTWNNANIVESYGDINSPMTFSFIQMAYSKVYRQFCQVIGVPETVLEKNENVFQQMLGFLKGRVYYNINHWYFVISLLPGFQFNKAFMEKMMGVGRPRGFAPSRERSTFVRLFKKLPEIISIALKLIGINLRWKKTIDEFFNNFYRNYRYFKNIDFEKLSPGSIAQIMDHMASTFLGNWKAPIINDLRCMVYFGVLDSLSKSWLPLELQEQIPLLLSGQNGIKSKEVVYRLMDLTRFFPKDSEQRMILLKTEPTVFLEEEIKKSIFEDFKLSFLQYLEEFGVRAPEEMKLESIPARERPEYVLGILQNYVRNGQGTSDFARRNEHQIRKQAEKKILGFLKSSRFLLGSKGKFLLRFARWTRNAIRDRENQRFCRSEVYDLARSAVVAVGRHWHEKGFLESPRDVFYLTWEEIWGSSRGISVIGNPKKLVQTRKDEQKDYKEFQFPGEFSTKGDLFSALESYRGYQNEMQKEDSALQGTGVCAGVVEAEVVVLTSPDPSVDLHGKILVAPHTDPGWVVMFPGISGLIVERGSPLSHSAIVAREMNIPAIVGVQGITRKVSSGQVLRFDGKNGGIQIVEKL